MKKVNFTYVETDFIMETEFNMLLFQCYNKPFKARCHGQNTKEYLNQREASRLN